MHRYNKPVVQNDLLITAEVAAGTSSPIQVGSQPWIVWLGDHPGFIYEGIAGHFTARRELRRGIGYWYGYRRCDGRLSKTYLGKSEELTPESLERACTLLTRQLPLNQLVGNLANLKAVVSPEPREHFSLRDTAKEIPFFSLTKINAPVLPAKFLSRPRLLEQFKTPVIFITAPGGFGKTTLLNEWRQNCGKKVAWVNLDPGDNHALRFWLTVVSAFQTINPGLGQDWISQLNNGSPSFLSRVVVHLTNDIIRLNTEQDDSQWIGLVLDNYHHVQNPEIHTSMQTFLDNLPANLKLAVSSHRKLPFALGYLRANGMVTEMWKEDLRFTREEGIEYLLRNTPGSGLSNADMLTLVRRTEGWITGLVLATTALSQQEDRSRFMESFTGAHPLLREFFTERVLYRLPPEMRTFLLKTSILKELNGPLCDTLTGESGGTDTLTKLWDEKLFLNRLERPGWFRYHEMFAEMLLTELQEQCQPEIPRLHRKAAKWYRTHNALAEAIHHLLLSKSWEKAAALIEDVALSEWEEIGEDSRLLRWLQQLPETMIQRHKTLLAVYIQLARLVLPPKEVDEFLARTEERIISMPASEKTSASPKTLTEVKRIRRLWAADNQVGLGYHTSGDQDVVGQMLDGIMQYSRDSRVDLVRAEEKANEVYEGAKARGHLFSILMAGGACANLAYSQGQLRRSEQVARKVLQQTNELRDKLPGPASIALTALSGVYYERNQVAQAHQFLERAVEVDPDPISTDESITMAILRAKIQSIQGDHDTAFSTIQAVRESYSRHPSHIWLDQDLFAYQALFRLQQEDLVSAERFLSGGWEIDKNPFSAFVRALILIEQNRNVAAEEILCHLLEAYPHGFYWVPILRVQVMLSTALFNQQKMNQARQVMAEAARMAAPEFFVRPFLSSNPHYSSLLSMVLHMENLDPGTRSFVKGTLAMLGHPVGTEEKSTRDEPMSLAIAASITPREQEVLRLLSAGLSNREIAERNFIAASTVKTHIENIFRKLGVNSRTQAIAQAQILNLV
jgi:LuxR family transcriptional regulator, maltose regulon positive regulatory protein